MGKFRSSVLFAFCLMAVVLLMRGFHCHASPCAFLASSIDTQYNASQLFIYGSRAYVCCTNKLFVMDVSSPENPVFVCSPLLSNGVARGAYVVGDYAYIVGGGKLQVMDFTKVSNPVIVGSVNISDDIEYIDVSGPYAYISGKTDFQIVNISSPQDPKLCGSLTSLTNARSLVSSGSYVYIADVESGVYCIDARDPNSPRVVSETLLPSGRAQDIFISGDYAYLAAYDGGLAVVDIKNPPNLSVASSLGLPDRTVGIYIYKSYAFLAWTDASYDGGVYIVDISNPNSPLYVETIDDSCSRDVHGEASYVYFTNRSGKLNTVDASGCYPVGPDAPTVASGSACSINSTSATINGTVNPNGASTIYYFQYGPNESSILSTTPKQIESGTRARF